MNSITDFYHSVTDVEHIVSSFGLIGIALVLFAETGLLIGFFLPGDSLLFVAGLFTGGDNPVFPLWQLLAVAVVFAIIGDQTGYQIGRWAGPPILRSRAARLIGEERIGKAQDFFATRGPHAVILARFVPVIRTIVPVLAASAVWNAAASFPTTSSAAWPGPASFPSPGTSSAVWTSSAPMSTSSSSCSSHCR